MEFDAREERERIPEKVLLATDGSKDAALAARAAVDVCEGTGAQLHVVHAWQSVPTARLRPFMRAELKKLGRLDEDLVRVVSQTLQSQQVSSFPIVSRSRPSTRAATLPPPEPSWWYNCNIIYKMLMRVAAWH